MKKETKNNIIDFFKGLFEGFMAGVIMGIIVLISLLVLIKNNILMPGSSAIIFYTISYIILGVIYYKVIR